MTRELAERLRLRATSYRSGGPSSEHTAAYLDEAADELDRLTAANARLREALTEIKSDTVRDSHANVLARAALSADGGRT